MIKRRINFRSINGLSKLTRYGNGGIVAEGNVDLRRVVRIEVFDALGNMVVEEISRDIRVTRRGLLKRADVEIEILHVKTSICQVGRDQVVRRSTERPNQLDKIQVVFLAYLLSIF